MYKFTKDEYDTMFLRYMNNQLPIGTWSDYCMKYVTKLMNGEIKPIHKPLDE